MIESSFDILSSMDTDESIDLEILEEIIEKTFELRALMKKLRDKYNTAGKLPLYHVKTDYENMMFIAELIENQALMFGKPVVTHKEYRELSKKEINEIKKDPIGLDLSGLSSWEEEGLL